MVKGTINQVPLTVKRADSSVVRGVLVSQTFIPSDSSKRVQVESMLKWSQDTLPLQNLIECGADEKLLIMPIL